MALLLVEADKSMKFMLITQSNQFRLEVSRQAKDRARLAYALASQLLFSV